MGILESFGGLPTHPLLVHFPIVLVPVTLILAILAVFWRRYQKGLAIALLCTGVIGGGAGFLAGESGEKLQHRLPDGRDALITNHASFGDTAKALCALLVIMSIVYCAWVWRDRLKMGGDNVVGRLLATPWVAVLLAVAMIGLAVVATVWVVLAGHSGAEAAWQETWNSLPPASPRGGD